MIGPQKMIVPRAHVSYGSASLLHRLSPPWLIPSRSDYRLHERYSPLSGPACLITLSSPLFSSPLLSSPLLYLSSALPNLSPMHVVCSLHSQLPATYPPLTPYPPRYVSPVALKSICVFCFMFAFHCFSPCVLVCQCHVCVRLV